MKSNTLSCYLGCMLAVTFTASATPILFPDGNFEQGTVQMILSPALGGSSSGTASEWDVDVAGLLALSSSAGTVDDGDSIVGRITFGLGLGGSASMVKEVADEFLPNSDYLIALNLRSDSLADLGGSLVTVEVLDGNGDPVASWVGSEILNLLDPLLDEFQTIELPFSTSDTAPTGPLSIRIGAISIPLLGYTLDIDDIQLDVEPTDTGGGGSGGGGSGGGGSGGGGSGGGTTVDQRSNRAPVVSVIGKSRFNTEKNRVFIKGRARDDSRIISVQYQFRGKVRSRAMRVAVGTNEWKFRFNLKSGRNVVRVRAVDNDGTYSHWKRIVVKKIEP